jgi:hypothetical protein
MRKLYRTFSLAAFSKGGDFASGAFRIYYEQKLNQGSSANLSKRPLQSKDKQYGVRHCLFLPKMRQNASKSKLKFSFCLV